MTEKTDAMERGNRLLARLTVSLAAGWADTAALPEDGIRMAVQGMLAEKALPVTLPGETGTDTGGTYRGETVRQAGQRAVRDTGRKRASVTPYEAARETRRQSELLLRA